MARGNKRQASNALAKFPIDFPTGVLQDFAGTSAPEGWLICDGSEVSRTEYAALFAVIGTTYGVGDGVDTFNLPDERGMFRRGLDNMGTAAGAAGVDVDGTARTVGQLQSDAMQRITGSRTDWAAGTTSTNSGAFNVIGGGGSSRPNNGPNSNRILEFDSADSTSPNPAKTSDTETRPMNHAYYVIIKA